MEGAFGTAMATRSGKNNSSGNTPVQRQERRKLWRGVIALAALLLLLIAIGFLLFWLNCQFFDRNARFTLNHITIESTGYWGQSAENRAELLRFMRLHPGSDNLFAIDPAKVREQIKSIPNVADATVERILPDTLQLRIEERVPRAFLGYSKSDFVVDANTMVMLSRQCFGVHPRLPVIVGLRDEVREGVMLPKLANALDLIMRIHRSFPEFQVVLLSVSQPDRIFMILDYRGRKRYQVTLPAEQKPELLDVLRSAIEDALRNNDQRTNVNLLFDGSVVMN